MEEYNAIEAAKLLGISDKTIRRHIDKGTIIARRKLSGELQIAVDQIEKLRQVLELEVHPDTVVHDQTELARQVQSVLDKLISIEIRLTEIEAGIRQQSSLDRPPTLHLDTSRQEKLIHNTSPRTPAQNRATEPNRAILGDNLMPASEFAARHGLNYQNFFKKAIERGINGDRLDITEIPHPTREGYVQKFLTPEQQKKAIELLERHRKLPPRNS